MNGFTYKKITEFISKIAFLSYSYFTLYYYCSDITFTYIYVYTFVPFAYANYKVNTLVLDMCINTMSLVDSFGVSS